jgi:hypothetical protein
MNVVLTTNAAYGLSTMVVVQSLKENSTHEGGVNRVLILYDQLLLEDLQRFWQLRDEHTHIFIMDLRDERWINLLGTTPMDRAAQMRGSHHELINLRLLFPEIFRPEILEAFDIPPLDHFLFLDSDILVVRDLAPLYRECLPIAQPIIGANLYSLLGGGDPICAYLSGGVGWVDKRHVRMSPAWPKAVARISGGVVFWHMRFFREIPARYLAAVRRGGEEEVVFGRFLAATQERVYFFSLLYNFRPSLEEVADYVYEEILETEIDGGGEDGSEATGGAIQEEESSLTDYPPGLLAKFKEYSGELRGYAPTMYTPRVLLTLFQIHAREVALWHWDSLKKPWEEGCTPCAAVHLWNATYGRLRAALQMTGP